MQKIDHQERAKFRNLWLLAICIHILTFLFILDLYFTSPIKHGMTPHKSQGKPFAKRIVVFLADGLRAEAIYSKDNLDRVEFLSNLRLNRPCTWGVAHTGVPTESRPGHVAIFAGLYEDPSAILTGWQANIVEFDSVINQSNYAWSYGSPDIVKIFTKTDKSKLFVDYYDPDQEDFSGRTSTIKLDTWVFDKVEHLLASNKTTNFECKELCEDGNIFFLHLLGMDTAGHVHKPDSKEYVANLKAIDIGIQNTEFLFNDFFKDNETAFLFTSDHGMTSWGSHGDGSEHETEVPYILWGKGIKPNELRMDLLQTDLAPLISSLIGIPIPINSMGTLPKNVFNGTYVQLAEAMFANVQQHVEQYKLLLKEFEMDPFFKQLPIFRENYMQIVIEDMRRILNNGDRELNVVEMGEELIKDILAANTYMRNYYFMPKMAVVMLGFFLWILYLTLSIHGQEEGKELIKFGYLAKLLPCLMISVVFYCLQGLKVKYFTYLYPIFPLGVFYIIMNNQQVISQIWIILKMNNKRNVFVRMLVYAVLVQLLVFGFFNRFFCAVVIFIMAFWLIQNELSINIKLTWLFATCMLALLQIFEPSTQFKYNGLVIGSFIWFLIYFAFIIREGNSYINNFDIKYKTWTRNIILSPLLGFTIAALNTGYVAHAFDTEEGLSDYNLIVSWAVSIAALMLIPAAPIGIMTRFGQIAGSLLIPYTLMAVNMDVIFYGILVLTLYYWVEMESQMHNSPFVLRKSRFNLSYTPDINIKLSEQYRRTYFYVALTVSYFFAIGNMASFNGFDPQWTRTYVVTFNPFLMAALIIIKMIIPFFLITCAFYAIVFYTRSDDTTVFTILLLFLDQMVLNFMLFVRNEGSWLDIGKSLSHFAVMEAMALVMLIFIGIAKYVCTFKIGNSELEAKKPEEFDDTNVEVFIEENKSGDKNYMQRRRNDEIKKSWWTYLISFTSIPYSYQKLILTFSPGMYILKYISKKAKACFDLLLESITTVNLLFESKTICNLTHVSKPASNLLLEDKNNFTETPRESYDNFSSSISDIRILPTNEFAFTPMTNQFLRGTNGEIFLSAFDLEQYMEAINAMELKTSQKVSNSVLEGMLQESKLTYQPINTGLTPKHTSYGYPTPEISDTVKPVPMKKKSSEHEPDTSSDSDENVSEPNLRKRKILKPSKETLEHATLTQRSKLDFYHCGAIDSTNQYPREGPLTSANKSKSSRQTPKTKSDKLVSCGEDSSFNAGSANSRKHNSWFRIPNQQVLEQIVETAEIINEAGEDLERNCQKPLKNIRKEKHLNIVNPPPKEPIIAEEIVNYETKLGSETSTLRFQTMRKGSRRQYMGSSPTLIKLNSNSTLITDANAAETRMSTENKKQMLEPTSLQNFEALTLELSMNNNEIFLQDVINYSDSGEGSPTTSESIQISSRLNWQCEDADKSPLIPDFNEDLTIKQSKNLNFKDSASVISFTGVTTCLKRSSIDEITHRGLVQTCFDVLPEMDFRMTPTEISEAILRSSEKNNPRYLSISFTDNENLENTPRFSAEGDDPSKYLLKVENWLEKLDNDKPQHFNTFEEPSSQSTVTSDDLIEKAAQDPLEQKLNMTIEHSRIEEEFTLIPNVNDQSIISIEIARLLTKEQQERNISIQTLEQAYHTVKFIFQCARTIKIRKQTTTDQDLSRESQTDLCYTSICTQTTEEMSSKTAEIVQIKMIPVGVKTNAKFDNLIKKNQSTQYKVDFKNKETSTVYAVAKTTYSIGIQHSFFDIGTNTEPRPQTANIGTQVKVMCDEQRVVENPLPHLVLRNIGINTIDETIQLKLLEDHHRVHGSLLPKNAWRCQQFCAQDTYRVYTPESFTETPSSDGFIEAQDVEPDLNVPVLELSSRNTNKNSDVIIGKQTSDKTNVSLELPQSLESSSFGENKMRAAAVSSYQLCHNNEMQRKLKEGSRMGQKLPKMSPVRNPGLITSRYESPPVTPIVEQPPSFVPPLKIPSIKVSKSGGNLLDKYKSVSNKQKPPISLKLSKIVFKTEEKLPKPLKKH